MSDLLSKLTSLRRYVDADEAAEGGSVLIDEQSPDGQYLYYEDAKSLVESELARLRLTDAEVTFLRRERDLLDADDEGDRKTLEIIAGLLARLGGGE